MEPTFKVSKVVVAPVGKKWWQLWRIKRTLKAGEHYTVKDSGMDIDLKEPVVLNARDRYEVQVFFDKVKLVGA